MAKTDKEILEEIEQEQGIKLDPKGRVEEDTPEVDESKVISEEEKPEEPEIKEPEEPEKKEPEEPEEPPIDWEKRFKDTEKSFHDKSQEASLYKKQVDFYEQQLRDVQEAQKRKEQEPDYNPEAEAERFARDPRGYLLEMLTPVMSHVSGEIDEVKFQVANPEWTKYKDSMSEIEKDPEFQQRFGSLLKIATPSQKLSLLLELARGRETQIGLNERKKAEEAEEALKQKEAKKSRTTVAKGGAATPKEVPFEERQKKMTLEEMEKALPHAPYPHDRPR